MKSLFFVGKLLLIVGLIGVSGYVHGAFSRRWGISDEMRAAGKRLDNVPRRIGDWEWQKSDELDDSTKKMLECAGYLIHTYENSRTRERVTVAIMLGPPGPIAVHVPEVCYSSRDYNLLGSRQSVQIAAGQGKLRECWKLDMQNRDVEARKLRMYYAWGSGGEWRAAQNPRVQFAAKPWLYKIQAASELSEVPGSTDRDPAGEFLKAFLPVLDDHLAG